MTDTTIRKSVFIKATPETVWSFLTDRDKLGQWFYPARAALQQNEPFELLKTDDDGSSSKVCWGTVTTMNAPTRLVYSFAIAPFGDSMSTVDWSLEAIDGGTRLTLQHDGIVEAAGVEMLFGLDSGWDRHLAALRGSIG